MPPLSHEIPSSTGKKYILVDEFINTVSAVPIEAHASPRLARALVGVTRFAGPAFAAEVHEENAAGSANSGVGVWSDCDHGSGCFMAWSNWRSVKELGRSKARIGRWREPEQATVLVPAPEPALSTVVRILPPPRNRGLS